MTCCEKCWGDAYIRSLGTNKDQPDCYKELLKERKDYPCSPKEQAGQFWDEESQCDRRNLKGRKGEVMKKTTPLQKFTRKRNWAKFQVTSIRYNASRLVYYQSTTAKEKEVLRSVFVTLGDILHSWKENTNLLKEQRNDRKT